jgi:uncharacterized membrane protein YbhN (UPF0104 family)
VTRAARVLRGLVSIFLFLVALWVLRDVLREYHLQQVATDLRQIAVPRLLAALVFTAAGYLALAGYDFVALHYLGRPLPWRRVLPIAFASYAVANSAPVSILTGGGIRYRLYARLGLSAGETARVAAFDVVTYLVGLFLVGGLAFVGVATPVPGAFHIPLETTRPIGVAFLAVLAGYLLLCALRRSPFRVWRWVVRPPSLAVAFAQMGISALDWLLSAAALYILFPAAVRLTYPGFLGVFLLAQIVALISPLPGGLGVFEAILLLLLPTEQRPPVVLGSLLIYRVIYYLLPLLAATTLLGVRSLRTGGMQRAGQALERGWRRVRSWFGGGS